ncbi:MAG: NUDIX hydrolase [Pseudomonadota bacterium]
MIWTPHVTVAAVIENEGRYLLVEEFSGDRMVYNQPAGHVEAGESILDAVVRETREETGWGFRPTALLGIYRWVHPANGDTYLRFCFTGECFDHDPAQPLDSGIVRTWWLTRPEMLEVSGQLRSPLVLRCVDDYLTGRRYPLDLYTDVPNAV